MTIPADWPRVSPDKLPLLRRYLQTRGLDAPPSWFEPFEGDGSLDSWLELQRRLSQALDDPDFGLRFGTWFPGMPSLLGHLLATCQNGADALAAFLRYQRLEHAVWHLELEPDGGGARVRFCPDHPLAGDRLIIDFAFASLLSAGERLTGRPIRPTRAVLSYPRPSRTVELGRVLGPELRFGAGEDRLELPREVLFRPVLGASPPARQALEAPLAAGLANLEGSGDYAGRVAGLVRGFPAGESPNLTGIARRLGLSPRALQHRLQAEGTSLSALRDAHRREMACRLLILADQTVKSVASLTGFSEPSAFHRAFVRWMGQTPTEWRRRHSGLD